MEDKSIGVPINSITEKSTPAADDCFLLDTPEGPRITKWGNIQAIMRSGIKGNATQSNAPTTYSAETHLDGLIETYRAVEPLDNTSAWYTLADATNKAKFPITQDVLNANDVLLTSTNGVVSVFLNAKPVPDVSDLIIKAGQNVAVILGTDSESALNVTDNFLITNDGTELSSVNYFISDFIKIEFDSLRYSTRFGSTLPAVCIYDANMAFIAGKNATEMTNTDTEYTERLLDDDFDLTNAVYVRISCANTNSLIVKYDEDIIINHTISTLEYGTDKPINSDAVKSIDTKVNEIYEVAKDVELLNNFIPYLEPAETFMRGYYGNENYAPNTTHSIVSRDNDYQLTTNITSHTGKQAYIVVFNGTKYFPIRVIDVNTATGVMKTADALPATCTNFQFLWGDGIHLSRHGYKAMAEWFVDNAILKNAQRKKRVFSIYTYDITLSSYERNFIRSGQVVLAMEKLTPGTKTGGWIDQPNGIIATLEMGAPATERFISSKTARVWRMAQNVAGDGVKFTVPNAVKGHIRLVCGQEYKEGIITGKVNVKAYDQNATEVYNQDLNSYGLSEILIPTEIENETVTFEISLLTSTTTVFTISEIEVVKSYLDNSNFIKENGVKIMYLCDSWGEFPNLAGGESGATRADGTTMGGLAYFPNHTETYLTSQGIDATIYNFSRGSQTSAWGDYWVDEFISRCSSKPDYCVVNFFINDNFSQTNLPSTPSVYDFSPTDPYSFQQSNVGGVFGSTSDAMWVANMKSICKKLLAENITPIIIGFPQFGDVAVSMEQRNTYFLNNFKF